MVCFLLLAGTGGVPATAQEKTNTPTPPTPTGNGDNTTGANADTLTPGLITSPTYRISVDDSLEISIASLNGFGPVIRSDAQTVLSDGTLDLPFIGETRVVGMTLAELKKRLKTAVDKYIEQPSIRVAVRGRYVKQINLFAPTSNRGKLPLRENWRIRDVIAVSGGLPNDRYDFFKAVLWRNRTGASLPIDLESVMTRADSPDNYLLEPEDSLIIEPLPETQIQIQVIGEVGRPGAILIPRSRSIIEALQAAGGPLPSARLSESLIERKGKTTAVDLSNYGKTGFEPAERLEFGDRLIIPRNRQEYYLFGSVGRSGTQLYPDDRKLKLSEVLAFSGGQVNGAELKHTRITRATPDGKTRSWEVNFEKMLKTGDFSNDPVIEPGDTIYVPPTYRRRGYTLFEILGLMSSVYFATSIFRQRLF